MNVWIFVITALLTPVAEPLGLSTPDIETAALAATAMTVPPTSMAASIDAEPRFHGIERMLAELDASQP